MIVAAGLAIRWLQFLSATVLVGSVVHAWLSRRSDRTRLKDRLERAVPFVLAGIVGVLAFSALSLVWLVASAAGVAPASVGSGDVGRFILGTRAGQVWMLRACIAFLLLALLPFASRAGRLSRRASGWLVAGLLAMPLAYQGIAALAGHGVGADDFGLTVAAHALHVSAASLWFGGLMFLALAAARDRGRTSGWACGLPGFSRLATGCMVAIAVSGAWLAVREVGTWPALFGTAYGRSLLGKLALLAFALVCAAKLRWRYMRALVGATSGANESRGAVRWILVEFAAAVAITWFAADLGISVPGRHDDIEWPFPVRIAPSAAWAVPGTPQRFGWGTAAAVVAGGVAWTGVLRRRRSWRLAGLVGLGAAVAFCTGALAIPAFPDTYRRSPVPYQAASVAAGQAIFRSACVECHGADASGRGPAAASLPKPPADLTAPHSADHTPGDLYWWLSHGIPSGGMPAFGSLPEEDRWDLVNYLHTLSRSYQARVLRERVVPERPWLPAPDFDYVDAAGAAGSLKDHRGRSPVLIVLRTACTEDHDRMAQLGRLTEDFRRRGVVALIVPVGSGAESGCPDAPVPQVREGNEAIATVYGLFRHTLENLRPGDAPAGALHMEFLVDRFGYLRARWVPDDVKPGWGDAETLLRQIDELARETQILPPPDEHLH